MPHTVVDTLPVTYLNQLNPQLCGVHTIIPILHGRKWRHREDKYRARRHTAGKWQSLASDSKSDLTRVGARHDSGPDEGMSLKRRDTRPSRSLLPCAEEVIMSSWQDGPFLQAKKRPRKETYPSRALILDFSISRNEKFNSIA